MSHALFPTQLNKTNCSVGPFKIRDLSHLIQSTSPLPKQQFLDALSYLRNIYYHWIIAFTLYKGRLYLFFGDEVFKQFLIRMIRAAKYLICCGIILCLNPYFVIFSFPIYLLGVILLIFKRSQLNTKEFKYWIFVPIISLLFLYFFMLSLILILD